ncbi:alcohol dehydrogenase catalytic domain-containing protein [Bifidobacterium pseudolongum]|uniref:alcohol dehydrogenase catalytic domain-containing protein n=1 Tax=Bifidobacterium pseudolongum TaxID=1694 RepID=UPI0027D7BD46|nr:alcohol dehydrogenase catalytic domain-containing protein [Bifidobacterium pseudolongum]
MKAAILDQYDRQGTPLRVCDIPDPTVGPDDVLVRVTFAGVNPLDNMIVCGEVKLIVPYRMPLTMGNEFVGVVERTGTQVTRFSAGERVYGRMPLDSIGAFAQFVSIPQSALEATPEYMNDEEAACVPLTALTAWQAYEFMHVAEGGRLFISGTTGSLGAMAVQSHATWASRCLSVVELPAGGACSTWA